MFTWVSHCSIEITKPFETARLEGCHSWQHTVVQLATESQKICQYTLAHSFTKCATELLPLRDSAVTYRQKTIEQLHVCHYTTLWYTLHIFCSTWPTARSFGPLCSTEAVMVNKLIKWEQHREPRRAVVLTTMERGLDGRHLQHQKHYIITWHGT